MIEADNLQSFIFETGPVKGQIAHLNETYLAILNQRAYPKAVRGFLGEAMLSCLLLASSIKFEGVLSLQFQGDARLPLLLVQCDSNKNIRAYAKHQADLADEAYQQAFLDGKMALTINHAKHTQAYQSIVPIQSISMADNLTHYFIQSEQIVTKVWLWTAEQAVTGILLQLMPGHSSSERENFWQYALHIGQTLTAEELFELSNDVVLHRLYHEEELRLFDRQAVRFQCHCTPVKMQQVLVTLGALEIEEILKEHGVVEVNCQFCNSNYRFDAVDIGLLFKNPQ